MASVMKELQLSSSLATSLASGHPWVYRDHVGNFEAPTGTWVQVKSGSFKGVALWDNESAIALRIFSTLGPVDEVWIEKRVQEAWDVRSEVRAQGVTGYRLIFGEADNLPGTVVDIYGDFAILVTYSKSLGALSQLIAQSVMKVGGFRGVARRIKKDDSVELRLLCGEPPPQSVIIEEFGMRLVARMTQGQKTGLFFDHRDNRHYVRSHCADASVLNLFSYSGGFSVAAALGGARAVTSVDIAKPAISDSVENFRLNGLATFPHEAICADVFEYLEEIKKAGKKFDVVVCDPPSFARNRLQLRAAEKAYRKVMTLGLSVVRPGGLFCGASCTSQIGPAAFRSALLDAARKARVRFQVVHDIGHAPDHPINIGHEEGRYLKFVSGRVLERC